MLFDPAVFSLTGLVPEWENGWDQKSAVGDFVIAPCAQASALFENLKIPGLYVRPATIPGVRTHSCKSEKEKLTTPAGQLFYPFNLLYDAYAGEDANWTLGENPAIKKFGKSMAVSFELFAMFGYYRNEMPEAIFIKGADIVTGLMEQCGGGAANRAWGAFPCEFRLDCQAYGVNRFLLQWFLEIKGQNRDAVKIADAAYLKAMAAIQSGKAKDAVRHLRQAFGQLAKLRKEFSKMDVFFLEYPHLGILFKDKGFFELEWPHSSREMLLSYFEHIEKHGYKVSLEGGAACWENLATRYPRLGDTIAKLWKKGTIELTNGTYSLPYALMSSLALQFWQFKKGNETFAKVFGKTPSVYQCQENSLTPQMPELLRHFGYQRALHITQNHGETPAENTDFINWASPAGHDIISMTARHPALSRKSNNYFLDLPLIHDEYGRCEKSLNYVNFQDLGYVPFRIHMIRAHQYAPVWGSYGLDRERFKLASENAPVKSYTADSYKLSEKFFYPNETNLNPFSHYENIQALSARLRQLRFAGCARSGRRDEAYRILDQCVGKLCLLEAHDCSYVQGQRRGEFHASNNIEVPPYSRETLTRKLEEITADAKAELDKAGLFLSEGKSSSKLFNAAEVPLAFGRIRAPESYRGANAVTHGADLYAVGPFPSFSSCEPAVADKRAVGQHATFDNGLWRIEVDKQGKLELGFKGQKMTCSPVDRKAGPFKLLNTAMKRSGGLVFMTLHYQQLEREIQTVILDLVVAEQGEYVEINLKYSPRTDFNISSKWNDFLALELQVALPLDKVWRFNPNVRTLTHEDRTVSPYYIAAESSDGGCFSLMNEGASLYELDRTNGSIRWLFHVFGEAVFNRRMGLVFGQSDVFQLSRAWGQGLLACEPDVLPILKQVDWQGISVEDFVKLDTLLISNLSNESRTVKVGNVSFRTGRNMLGKSIASKAVLKLKPMELALVQI